MYRISLATLEELVMAANPNPASKRIVRWDNRTQTGSFRYPRDAGVAPDGNIWIAYGSQYDYARVVWIDSNGTFLATIDYPYRGSFSPLIGID